MAGGVEFAIRRNSWVCSQPTAASPIAKVELVDRRRVRHAHGEGQLGGWNSHFLVAIGPNKA
jgi:hypothetical protein